MKMFYFTILSFLIVAAGFYQFLLGHKRLYYDSYYHLFVFTYINKFEVGTGEMRIGKSLFSMDNIIICEQNYEMPLFDIRPLNDTLYLYDTYTKIKEVTSKSIPIVNVRCLKTDSAVCNGTTAGYFYAFEDSTAMLLNHLPICIGHDLSPVKCDEDKHQSIFLQRLF